ncbi:MAG: sigma-70 family RNA polymerase sigma factor [Rubripirellula sp.]
MSPESAVGIYARSGDPNAFRTLVESYQNLVYSVCRRILPDADIDDAVQEVFVKLSLNASNISSDLGAWLHACSVNTCRDMLRRNQSRRNRERANAKFESQSAGSGQDAAAILAEVDAALLDLSHAERTLIVRYYLQGDTQQIIADELDVTQSTVKRRIDNAMEKLRLRLGRREVATPAIAALLIQQTAQGGVPKALSAKLIQLGLAWQATTSGVGIGKWFLHAVLIAITAVLLVLGGHFIYLASRSSRSTPSQIQPFQVVTLKKITYFQQTFPITLDFNVPLAINQVEEAMNEQGLVPIGPPTFIHPEGLLPDEEGELILAFPVDPSLATHGLAEIVHFAERKCVIWEIDGALHPRDAVIQLDEMVSAAGHVRTFKDRFVCAGHGTDTPGLYVVQYGIE